MVPEVGTIGDVFLHQHRGLFDSHCQDGDLCIFGLIEIDVSLKKVPVYQLRQQEQQVGKGRQLLPMLVGVVLKAIVQSTE